MEQVANGAGRGLQLRPKRFFPIFFHRGKVMEQVANLLQQRGKVMEQVANLLQQKGLIL